MNYQNTGALAEGFDIRERNKRKIIVLVVAVVLVDVVLLLWAAKASESHHSSNLRVQTINNYMSKERD